MKYRHIWLKIIVKKICKCQSDQNTAFDGGKLLPVHFHLKISTFPKKECPWDGHCLLVFFSYLIDLFPLNVFCGAKHTFGLFFSSDLIFFRDFLGFSGPNFFFIFCFTISRFWQCPFSFKHRFFPYCGISPKWELIPANV